MTPVVIATFRVHLSEVESRVCSGGVGSHRLEYVLADGLEVGDPGTWVAIHEVVVDMFAVWGEAVDVESLFLDSVSESDEFCLIY